MTHWNTYIHLCEWVFLNKFRKIATLRTTPQYNMFPSTHSSVLQQLNKNNNNNQSSNDNDRNYDKHSPISTTHPLCVAPELPPTIATCYTTPSVIPTPTHTANVCLRQICSHTVLLQKWQLFTRFCRTSIPSCYQSQSFYYCHCCLSSLMPCPWI